MTGAILAAWQLLPFVCYLFATLAAFRLLFRYETSPFAPAAYLVIAAYYCVLNSAWIAQGYRFGIGSVEDVLWSFQEAGEALLALFVAVRLMKIYEFAKRTKYDRQVEAALMASYYLTVVCLCLAVDQGFDPWFSW